MDVMSGEVHRYVIERELAEAGFTPDERAAFLEALDANTRAITPWQRSLLDRHRNFAFPFLEVT